jgi:hypothetical protein
MAANLEVHLSGGTGNTDKNAALGGARSTAGGGVVPTALTANSLFDDVSGAEEAAGDIEYRCVYIRNTGDQTAESSKVWLTDTADADTTIAIALAGEGLNATAETVANENTAPVGETFSTPTTEGAGLSLGNIPASQHYAIWIRRTVAAGAGASNDSFTLSVSYDTLA